MVINNAHRPTHDTFHFVTIYSDVLLSLCTDLIAFRIIKIPKTWEFTNMEKQETKQK